LKNEVTLIIANSWVVDSAPEGSVARLLGEKLVDPILDPDLVGDYVISLVVSDGFLDSIPNKVIIHVTDKLVLNIKISIGSAVGVDSFSCDKEDENEGNDKGTWFKAG